MGVAGVEAVAVVDDEAVAAAAAAAGTGAGGAEAGALEVEPGEDTEGAAS